ncbi:MAG: hypothetical protein JO044_11905 [Mycobacteriaceae bacterium]|nr:hypothetical protein [Mycobacteriaceae bacterium]MBV9638669.1 hypothetical protein [Mycobacteriaceae bacterium]
MRKTLAVTAATGALLFGGAGVAHATGPSAPAPTSTTTLAQNNDDNNHSDKTGLWGLVGLLGLGGLAGLARRRDHTGLGAGPAAPGTRGQTPGI